MVKMKRDYLIGGILTLLGIVAMLMSMQVQVKTGSTDPGSRIFPLLASGLLTVCGVGVLISAAKSEDKAFLSGEGWKKLLMAFGCMVLYILALKYLGFLISTPVFLFAIITMLAGGEKVAIWKKAAYALVVTGLSWYLFHSVLSMSLPNGVLF